MVIGHSGVQDTALISNLSIAAFTFARSYRTVRCPSRMTGIFRCSVSFLTRAGGMDSSSASSDRLSSVGMNSEMPTHVLMSNLFVSAPSRIGLEIVPRMLVVHRPFDPRARHVA